MGPTHSFATCSVSVLANLGFQGGQDPVPARPDQILRPAHNTNVKIASIGIETAF
jgi:hypothetical protein